MKAVFIRRYGGPEVLEYGEFPNPAVGAGEVLVKVAAAAINPIDIMERSGLTKDFKPISFPGVLGWDLSGTVVRVGPGALGFSIGDRVLAWAYHTYAELCAVKGEEPKVSSRVSRQRLSPDAGKLHVRVCVQRRLACSAGERPAGARVRSPVVWIAGWRETKTLKPIDNVSLGKTTSHRAVTTVNAKVASKVRSPEGRVLTRRAKAAWGAEI